MKFYEDVEKTDNYGRKYTVRNYFKRKIALTIMTPIWLLMLLLSSFVVVPSGFTGVRIVFGQVSEQVVPNGVVFKIPFFQKIEKVNNKQQDIVFTEKIWGESSERTVVYAENVNVTYRINPEYSSWIYKNVSDYRQNALPATLAASAIKASMVSLASNEVTNRAKIEPLAVKNLQTAIDAKYGGNQVISIVNVNIDNMDFEADYNKAVSEKQVAQMQLEKQRIENEKIIEQANKDAEVVRIQTEYQTSAKIKQAEADAEVKRIAAEAEAEANRKIAESLSHNLIEYKKIDKWDGAMPKVTGSTPFVKVDAE